MSKTLPRGWNEVKLKDIGEILGGGTPSTANKEYWNGDILWVTPTEVTALKTKYLYDTERKITELGLKNSSAKMIKPNSLIICTRATIGDCCINKKEISTNQGFKSITPNNNYDVVFLYYLINYNRNLLIANSSGSTFLEISKSNLENLSFYFPPLDEQNRIAEVLSLCDKLIENLTKLIEKKEIYKKGVMQRVLTGKVRFNGFTDEWETVRLGDIATITSAGVDKKINDNETKVRLLNYLDVFNRNKLYDNEISFITSANENQIKKCDIKKGDLFITPSSEDREGIAKSAVAMEDFTNVVYSYHIIRLRFNREIDLKFKSYMCDTALFHRQAYRLCDGSGQRYVISLGTFREMEIYIPKSVEEQKKIGELLSLIDQDIDNLKQLLHLRKLQKKGLMQKLLTGEVRI